MISNMDPVLKIWMYNNWVQDQQDSVDLAKDHAYLLGSFSNPEAVRKLLNDTKVVKSSDDDFDKATEKLLAGKFNDNVNSGKNRKKRKVKS